MSALTTIQVSVDRELKEAAETVFQDIGLTMTGAITLFLRSVLEYDGIPFETESIPNDETKSALAEYEAMRNNPTAYKRYQSFDELFGEVFDDA